MARLRNHGLAARIVDLADRHGRAGRRLSGRRVAFPNRWSHLLGHMALFSFLLTIVSGVLLTLWFEPSMSQIVYDGGYAPLRGVRMSEAYASTLDISLEIRGGLLIRQIHHWASLVFIAALSAHLLRVFLSGAFRGPRWFTWLILLTLVVLGIAEAYIGHSLPDDLQSGTGLRVTEGYVLAVPVVGTSLAWLLFDGEFPGDDIIPRLNTVHVVALPSLMVALFAVQLVIMYRSRQRRAVAAAGEPVFPGYAAKMGGFVLLVCGVIVLMAATIQINPVWLWGPFDASQAPAGSRPPWYLGFIDGAVRLMPPWQVGVLGHELTLSVLVPVMVMPGVVVAALALYPWFEQWATGDRRDPDVLDRPRDMPVRTGLGAAFVAFYLVLWIGGGNDAIAPLLHVSMNGLTRFLQISLVVAPPLAFWITKRICLGLQLGDREEILHGRASGVVVASPEGEFAELHRPLSAREAELLTSHPDWTPIDPGSATDANGVPNPEYRADRRRAKLSRFYFADIPRQPTRAEIGDHRDDGEHDVTAPAGTH